MEDRLVTTYMKTSGSMVKVIRDDVTGEVGRIVRIDSHYRAVSQTPWTGCDSCVRKTHQTPQEVQADLIAAMIAPADAVPFI